MSLARIFHVAHLLYGHASAAEVIHLVACAVVIITRPSYESRPG